MATITLYKDKINGVGSLLDDIIKSSNNLNAQLGTLKSTLQGVDSSTCNLQDTVDSISSSSKSESDKVEDLKRLNNKLTAFIEMTARRDSSAESEINKAKEDFYTKYSYLKPECEKSRMEKIADGMKKACEWCKEHWKEICLVLEVVVAIVCLCIPGLQGVGMMILTGMLIGFLSGAIMGGLAGYAQYGIAGILPGVIDGSENGMLIGGLMGGFGGVGALAGATFGCSVAVTTIFSISTKITIGMMAFDLTALAYNFQNRFLYDTGINLGLVEPTAGKFISDLNQKAHSNPFYNALQLVASGAAAFSGGYVRTAACFIAGTVIATVDGFVQIENIKNGDIVLSTDVDTMRVRYMQVLDTYIRKVDKLVHLTINNETLITTVDHPFYVNGQGFIRAEALCIGSQLMDVQGNICCVEQIFHEELCDEKRTVYNFQVDDYHTYHVGHQKILVHNAGAEYGNGHYENNPSENPKVLADAEEDPNAVYGYRPRSDGSLKKFANKDWSDSQLVENARLERLDYIAKDRAISQLVSDMKKQGYSTEDIARAACDYRNQTRLNSYIDSNGKIIDADGYAVALERMTTRSYDALIQSGKTPEQIIGSSTRTNPAMDACVGLYDDNFNTY